MARSKIWLLVTIIFGVGIFLRTYRIADLPPGLYPDEAMNGSNAFEAITTGPPAGGYKVYYPENNGREGLFMNIQAQFLRVLVPMNGGNPEPWMLRIVSTLFGSLTALGMFFLGRELFRGNDKVQISNDKSNPNDRNSKSFDIARSDLIGLAAMFFTATSFWHIMFSRIGFRAIMAPCFLVWSLYFLLLAIRKAGLTSKDQKEVQSPNDKVQINDKSPKSKNIWHLIFGIWILPALAGLAYGLGFYSYIAYRVSPLLLLLVIPFFRKVPNFWKVVGIFVAAAFVVALPIGLYYLQNPADFMGRTSQVSVFSSPQPLTDLALNIGKTLQMFFVVGDLNQRHNLSGAPQLFWPIGIFFLLGIALGVKTLLRSSNVKVQSSNQAQNQNDKVNLSTLGNSDPIWHLKFGLWICFAWFFLALLPVVISNEGLPHALRAILLIPPTMLFAALGAVWIFEKLAVRSGQWAVRALPAIIGFAVAVCLVQVYRQYFVVWANDPATPGAFAANYVELGREIRLLPNDVPKYVVVYAGGVDVRGVAMPAQTVMYMTDTFTPEKQQAKNIYYLRAEDLPVVLLPADAKIFEIR